MKRLFVSAALLPLLWAATAAAEAKITTATTAPVRTSTAASGRPDSVTIDTTGTIAPTAPGAAVTVDSAHAVTNNGAISFNNVSGATGIAINSGVSTTVTNAGAINVVEDYSATDTNGDGNLDGPFAQGSGRYGIRATGPAPVTGAIVSSGAISVEGNDSVGISVETRLNGSLTSSGAITVLGDRTVGVRAASVSGDVSITGSIGVTGAGATAVQLGDVGGTLLVRSAITATGYRNLTRQTDAVRALFGADDLLQGGPAVSVTGSVGHGILLDVAADTTQATAAITSASAAPALDIGGPAATTIGAVGTGDQAFGLINRGSITGAGVNDGVAAIGLRIGRAGGGTVTVQGGINNQAGTIVGRANGAQATALLLNPGAVVTTFRNSGTVGAEQNGGLHDARAIVDLSGTLALVQNSGAIKAVVNPVTGVAQTGRAIAIDLSANTTGAVVRQAKVNTTDAPSIGGDVLFGSGDDRLELLGGSFAGTMNFGAGADTLILDGGATAAGRIVDGDGRLAIDVRSGTLAVANAETVKISSLNLGATGVLAFNIDPTVTTIRLKVAGAATIVTGAQVAVTLASLSRGAKSFQVVQAGSLTVGQAGATLAGAPYLYAASLRADTAAGALYVDLRPKTAVELGLNRSGREAYGAVFEALDKDAKIEAAFLGQATKAGFQGLYDQMLPDHSGGTLMSAAAVSQAVSQAVAEPLKIDKDAATGVWAQEIAFNLRRDRADAAGFLSQGFGFAAGLDLQGQSNALGANVSFVTTDVKDRGAAAGEQVSMNVLGAGLYWRLDGGPLQATVRGGVGYAFLSGDRRLVSSTLDLRAKSDSGAWMADGYAGAAYAWRLGGFYARPQLSASYLRLSEGGYHETGGGTGFDLSVDRRTGDLLTGEALMSVGWRFGDEVYWAPEVTAGYRAKLAGGPAKTTARFDGGATFTLDPEDAFKGGAVVRAGIRGGSGLALYTLSGGATVDKDYREYDVRAVIRFQF
ncbi:autotransporter outer membrane beta-barrel domain-containing protein [Phenylobacterium sp.]|uniref:autotransporter outer membrane beta-barrel domain-containing protein n=1 Tax=Phenylobacterium sp. TaxID=1871053 RepID=UPI0025EFE4B2|nr:autotransporter outer membrane beta-barrel domain-containing protein [Phenylobacterium sp.]